MPNPYQTILFEALRKVTAENGYLSIVGENRDINERSLTHRLAFYLEQCGYFSGYNIDCEYNRHGTKSKRNARDELIYPDIVIHIRGDDDHNHLIIQAKKFNDTEAEVQEARQALRDAKKPPLKYKFAFLIIFPQYMEVSKTSIIEI